MNVLGFIFVLACLPQALIDFALPAWKREPNFKIEDAYKWIYQAARGGEHAAPSRKMAEKYLDEEWNTLTDSQPGEPLWQPLCPNESIGRINLRVFRQQGGQKSDLIDAFVRSGENFKTNQSDFLAAWNELARRLKRRSAGSLTFKDWSKLDEEMKKQAYPAIHHSSTYEKTLYPAYRVLIQSEHQKLLSKLKTKS